VSRRRCPGRRPEGSGQGRTRGWVLGACIVPGLRDDDVPTRPTRHVANTSVRHDFRTSIPFDNASPAPITRHVLLIPFVCARVVPTATEVLLSGALSARTRCTHIFETAFLRLCRGPVTCCERSGMISAAAHSLVAPEATAL
jgi:hypothetical protein